MSARRASRFLFLAAAALPLVDSRALAAPFSLGQTGGGTWNTNYAQGFSPSIEPNPNPGSQATDASYLQRFQFFKSGTADSASNIRLAIVSNIFMDVATLTTSSPEFVGLSTNTVASTASLSTGSPITFTFNDLALTYGDSGVNTVWGNYGAIFVNVGGGGQLTPVLVSSLTANYQDIGGGQYHPVTNYGGESGSYWYYSASNYKTVSGTSEYFSAYSWGGDTNFAAALSSTQASRWNAGSGDWTTSGNWLNGSPNAANAPAVFPSAGSPVAVNADANVSVGTINFDGASSYAVSGAGTLTLDATTGWAYVGVTSGSHAINAPLALADHSEFAVAPGAQLAVGNLQSSALTVLKTGAGELQVNNVRSGELRISGGTVKVAQNGAAAGTSRVNGLTIASDAKLDLTDNKLIVAGGNLGSWNGSAYTGITGLIQSGRGDGSWNGNGIVTSMSDATSGVLTTLAVALAEETGHVGGTFGGQPANPGDVLVFYTWGGDADLNGELNGDDYFYIDSNAPANGSVFGFHNGDFDLNGTIDGDDYFIIDSNITFAQASPPFSTGAGAGRLAAVPEPSGGVLVAGAVLTLARRRGRCV